MRSAQEIILETICGVDCRNVDRAHAAIETALAALSQAGYVIVPKPISVCRARPGTLALEYEDTEDNRKMTREVAASLFS